MRTIKRSECSVLPLVLKGKWYDMIASGEKKEEYRDATHFYWSRVNNWCNKILSNEKKHFVVAFSSGYRTPDMFFIAKLVPNSHFNSFFLRRAYPHPEWGEPDTPHYVIALQERVNMED